MEDFATYQPSPVTTAELPLLAAEVAREYWMVKAAGLMLFAPNGTLNPLLRDVIVQAFNMHVRVLTDFFGRELPTRRQFMDDVVALHFAPEWDRGRHGHVDLAWLETSLVAGIHKRTAHLTAYRVRVPATWDAQPLVEICAAISSLMARFLHLLPEERRVWFELNGEPPDVGWVFRDVLGMVVDGDYLRLLLGTEAVPIGGPPATTGPHASTVEATDISADADFSL